MLPYTCKIIHTTYMVLCVIHIAVTKSYILSTPIVYTKIECRIFINLYSASYFSPYLSGEGTHVPQSVFEIHIFNRFCQCYCKYCLSNLHRYYWYYWLLFAQILLFPTLPTLNYLKTSLLILTTIPSNILYMYYICIHIMILTVPLKHIPKTLWGIWMCT